MGHIYIMILLFAAMIPGLRAETRVGLALGGGGAKGLAHIGILKAFEEAGIPVDMIAGTSAGAMIGAAYAAGLSVQDMEELAKNGRYAEVFSSSRDISSIPIEYRVDDLPAQLDIAIRQNRFVLPMAILDDEMLNYFLFEQLSQAAAAVSEDFSRLAVPFYSVAADVQNRQAVLLQSGSLWKAVRASIAYPLAIAPVRHEMGLLMDGGIYDNLPINALRTKGADFIIAVNVSDIPPQNEELQGIDDVFSLLSNVLAPRSDSAAVSGYDQFIQVDCSEISLLDFNAAVEAVEAGYLAGRAAVPKIRRHISEQRDMNSFLKRTASLKNAMEGHSIDEIKIEGDARYPRSYVLNLMESREQQPFRMATLQRDLYRLSGSGLFEQIMPDLHFDPSSDKLSLVLHLKGSSSRRLQAGMYYDSDANLNLYAQHSLKMFSGQRFQFRNRLFIGDHHSGLHPQLQLFNVLQIPIIRYRMSSTLGLKIDHYNYNSELPDIDRIGRRDLELTWSGLSGFGWNTLLLLSSSVKRSALIHPSSGELIELKGRSPDDWYFIQRNTLIYDRVHRQLPVLEGLSAQVQLNFGKHLDPSDPAGALELDRQGFAVIQADLNIGFRPIRSFGGSFRLESSFSRGILPLGEYTVFHLSESGHFTFHEAVFSQKRLTARTTISNRFLRNDLWAHLQFSGHMLHYYRQQDMSQKKISTLQSIDLFLRYHSPLGPLSYGLSYLPHEKYPFSSWASLGFTF